MKRIPAAIVISLALAGLLALTPEAARAQSAGPAPQQVTLFELVLRDGSRMYGEIEREDDTEVIFRTRGGTVMTVKRTDILSLRRRTGVLAGQEFQRADPNTTRLFFGPTGKSLEKGQSYVGVYEVLLPFVQVGVTDRFSIGAGTPLIFGAGSNHPFWITPKLQIVNTGSTQAAVGVLQGFSGDSSAGIAYVVGTHGTALGSFSAGAGLAYESDGGRAGVVMAGGQRQVRQGLAVISENYLWKGGNGIVSLGVRFFGERLSADLGLAAPIGGGFIIFPVVNFVYLFER
ncbi:MAG: hypothetical protein A3H96_27105 [Acidobacteria bacterium RIFCSPLOWO2_02_FULL_67_36]|nr:MAG: hypothetical protein A3H96_27105 [Acidobacteria bacterium RIFCSPLOWO2_02_FULL_67_36]OFW24536.1 MAG: hypothetical protein A3G21_18450 [Acidobacteria bacterium RIFCSPLOWO2_12_FULL_66_21]